MIANYLITENVVKLVNEGVSDCTYYIKDEDLLLMKNNKGVRKAFLDGIGVNSIIVGTLGNQDNDTFNKDGISIIKVGDKRWV